VSKQVFSKWLKVAVYSTRVKPLFRISHNPNQIFSRWFIPLCYNTEPGTSIFMIHYYFVIIIGFIWFVHCVVFWTEHIILETGSHRKLFSVTSHTKPVSYMLCLEYKAVDRVKKALNLKCHWSLFWIDQCSLFYTYIVFLWLCWMFLKQLCNNTKAPICKLKP
jgi:hypothetical protein